VTFEECRELFEPSTDEVLVPEFSPNVPGAASLA
jgi:hypothetical protein